MAIIITLVVIMACVAQQLIFSSLARSVAMFISAIVSSLIAMNFYEPLAKVMIDSDMMTWKAHGIAMGLLFVLSLAILAALSIKLLSGEIAFGGLVDKIGGAAVAVFTGYIASGVLIIALGLASGSNSFPYARFAAGRPDMASARSAFLGTDAFEAGMFSLVSGGSLAGSNSFAALHAGLNDASGMDRLAAEKKLSPLAGKGSIQGPAVIWAAPDDVTGPDGKKLEENPGHELVLVRLNMTKSGLGKDSPNFLLGQLRMICRGRDARGAANEGAGTCIFPAGYMKTATSLALEPTGTMISLADAQMTNGAKTFDFAFYVPSGMKPSLIEFKRNVVMMAPAMVDAKEVTPAAEPEKPKETKPAAEPNRPR
jgi:hypothetical protein